MEINPRNFTPFIVVCVGILLRPAYSNCGPDMASCSWPCSWMESGFCEDGQVAGSGCDNYHDESSCPSGCTWRETSYCMQPADVSVCDSYANMTSCDADSSCQWAGSHCDSPYDSCGDVFSDNGYNCHDSKVLDVFKPLEDPNKSETELNSECCVVGNCYLHMTSTNQQCQSGFGEMRGYMDGHIPDEVDDVNGWSSVDVQNECCQNSCFSTMRDQHLTCPAGLVGRSRGDHHNPFDIQDWSTLTPAAIISGCCERNCYAEMMSKNLTCDTGRMRDETDFMNPWKDITDEFLQIRPLPS